MIILDINSVNNISIERIFRGGNAFTAYQRVGGVIFGKSYLYGVTASLLGLEKLYISVKLESN